MSYFGGKGGVFRILINQIPPHEAYVEPFLGHGAILLNKKPATLNLGIDVDPEVITHWVSEGFSQDRESSDLPINKCHLNIKIGDAIECLKKCYIDKKTFVYCDPPYLIQTRKSGSRYRFEYTDAQHRELLELLLSLKAMIMISGYRHAIYDDALSSWRRIDYMASTRQGSVEESAWMNYPVPTRLHDYRYLGENFRQRERIKKKKRRWMANLKAMPVLEQQAILEALTR